MEGSKWDEVLDKLTEQLAFELRGITRNEIIKFCVENKTTRQAAEDFLKKYKKVDGKCSVRAREKIDEAEEKYRRELYADSLLLYTESIYSASKSDECLPLAYSNRARLLLRMSNPPRRNYMAECLADIDMFLDLVAGKCDVPELLISMKLFCLCYLDGTEKAQEFLENYEERCNNKEVCTKLREQLAIHIKILKEEDDRTRRKLMPQLAGGENENFVSASKYLSVHYDENRGRCVVAAENIEPGDVLFVEKPFAHILFDKGCQNCLKSTQAPIPCFSCCDVSYCSKNCMDEFERVHSFECGFGELFKSVGIAHLSLRVVLNASGSFHDLKSVTKNILQPEHNNGVVLYRSKEYDSVYNLVHHSDKHELVCLFQYAMTGLLLALHLKHNTKYFVGGSPTDEELEYVASRIWLHILQLICNGHATTRILTTGGGETQVVREAEVRCGTSIYPSASMMNHSCEPNIVHNFRDKWLIVRAAKPIRRGEEVFNCYGTHARRMSRAKRQEVLRNQYFFQCKCPECLSSHDVHEVLTAFKCAKCQGPAVQKVDSSQTLCLECGLSCDIPREVSYKHDRFYALIKEGELLRCEDSIRPLKIFVESWLLGREIFYKFHIDLAYAAKEVARCLACLNDFEKCIAFLRCCARSVEVRFGTCSIEHANELKTLSEAVIRYASECEDKNTKSFRDAVREAGVSIEKANGIVNLLCGPESEESLEMEWTKVRVCSL